LITEKNGAVIGFNENPGIMENHFVPMGVYIYNWNVLRKRMIEEQETPRNVSRRNFTSAILEAGLKLYAHRFEGYWRDVETVEDLWTSNMDLLGDPPELILREKGGEVLGSSGIEPLYVPGKEGNVNRSIFAGLHVILGKVEHSILSDSVVVEEGAEVVDSILMPNVYVGRNAKIRKAIVGPNCRLMSGVEIGTEMGADDFVSDRLCSNGVSLISSWVHIAEGIKLQKNSHIGNGMLVTNSSCLRVVNIDYTYGARALAPALKAVFQSSGG
jgi:glucose-1-phosphate adenylyltransferase